ncbi:hypothetical protein [Nocardioides sp. AX2bis]|uniref:hypothetical protein n=1 Tax=Nocardioides sp. AX2bis TaxID=2653157 RepID=UPI0013598F40|nr:hypothetical protein [Nocardioides sp. AX2bis]
MRCLLGQVRRALTSGHTTATHVRARLCEYLDHLETTVDHRWALSAASRDFWTAGMDALGHTHPQAQHATLAEVAPDGSAVYVAGSWVPVVPAGRQPVAALRTSRRLAGCVETDGIDGVFDNDRGLRPRRRAPST